MTLHETLRALPTDFTFRPHYEAWREVGPMTVQMTRVKHRWLVRIFSPTTLIYSGSLIGALDLTRPR